MDVFAYKCGLMKNTVSENAYMVKIIHTEKSFGKIFFNCQNLDFVVNKKIILTILLTMTRFYLKSIVLSPL